MTKRGLDFVFTNAMRHKLQCGRNRGYVGWDRKWNDCTFQSCPTGRNGFLMQKLLSEVAELIVAVSSGNKASILEEAADVANLAMMVSDVHDANTSETLKVLRCLK